jgi:hypothetical protein
VGADSRVLRLIFAIEALAEKLEQVRMPVRVQQNLLAHRSIDVNLARSLMLFD